MENETQYWTLLRLKADGSYQPTVLAAAQTFLLSQNLDRPETIIPHLLSQSDPRARLCLRCYISHEIVQTCAGLVRQFGQTYQFQMSDILPFVLDDQGHPNPTPYKPLAQNILDRFVPQSGSLRNWTIRLVRQQATLQAFLLEQGLHLITDWAILNDTEPTSLERILPEFHQLTQRETQAAITLLGAYRNIYRRDRQHKAGRQRCQDPTEEQLQRIALLLPTPLAPSTILSQLKKLAHQLRQYRIHRRGSKLHQGGLEQSLDIPEIAQQIEYQISQLQDDDIALQMQTFLQEFRQEFAIALEQSLSQVVQARLQQKPKKAKQFLLALEQLHCQRRSMGDIALDIGLKRQDDVSRLLQLKAFRSDVRNLILHSLKTFIQAKGKLFVDPDRLIQVAAEIETALEAQIDDVIAAAQKEATTIKGYITPSLFTQKLCAYLHQTMTVP
jgi:hypothetical protein